MNPIYLHKYSNSSSAAYCVLCLGDIFGEYPDELFSKNKQINMKYSY